MGPKKGPTLSTQLDRPRRIGQLAHRMLVLSRRAQTSQSSINNTNVLCAKCVKRQLTANHIPTVEEIMNIIDMVH